MIEFKIIVSAAGILPFYEFTDSQDTGQIAAEQRNIALPPKIKRGKDKNF